MCLMVFNGLFSSLKVSSLFSTPFCPRFVLSCRCPRGTHACSGVRLLPWAAFTSLLPLVGARERLCRLCFGSGRGWCLLEEAGTVQAEERVSRISCRVQTWAKALH